MSATTVSTTRGLGATRVMHPRDVVSDDILHPGAVVWLAEPWLRPAELDLFRTAARAAAMAQHPAGRARHLRVV